MTASRSPRGPRPADTTILVVDDDPVILTLGSELALQIRSTQRWVRVKKPFAAAQLVSRIRETLSA
jgi:hypothetical protein